MKALPRAEAVVFDIPWSWRYIVHFRCSGVASIWHVRSSIDGWCYAERVNHIFYIISSLVAVPCPIIPATVSCFRTSGFMD